MGDGVIESSGDRGNHWSSNPQVVQLLQLYFPITV